MEITCLGLGTGQQSCDLTALARSVRSDIGVYLQALTDVAHRRIAVPGHAAHGAPRLYSAIDKPSYRCPDNSFLGRTHCVSKSHLRLPRLTHPEPDAGDTSSVEASCGLATGPRVGISWAH